MWYLGIKEVTRFVNPSSEPLFRTATVVPTLASIQRSNPRTNHIEGADVVPKDSSLKPWRKPDELVHYRAGFLQENHSIQVVQRKNDVRKVYTVKRNVS